MVAVGDKSKEQFYVTLSFGSIQTVVCWWRVMYNE
jgi:hypothetical protein